MISFAVVINGPVAKAGSNPNLFNNKGIIAPFSAANTITKSREKVSTIQTIDPDISLFDYIFSDQSFFEP